MQKKQKKRLLIIGSIAAGLGVLYLATRNSAAAAPAATTTSAPANTVTATATTATPAAAPTGTIDFFVNYVDADNQAGAYNVMFNLTIQNNTNAPVTVTGVSGQAIFIYEPNVYGPPKFMPYTGALGPFSDTSTFGIPAGQSSTKDYWVNVPVNDQTNLYVASLAYVLAEPGTRSVPFTVQGSAVINGQNVPFKINYLV